MIDDVAIKVNGVTKDFKLPHQKINSLKTIFTGIYKKKRRSFEVQHALKDISFEIKKGEFFGIVGRNGSGKSTLLKILAEIYRPTTGDVSIQGRLVPFIELGVGFNPELTGRENVYLNGALLGFSEKEIDDQYDDIVSFAELAPFMDQKLKNYSSGMQVRLAFSVATRAKAEILLIDEVLAVGDADFQRKCFNYFKSLKRSHTTVVFVSHDMSAVREYCDRALLIDNSEIVDIGNTDKIAQQYTRLFLEDDGYSNDGDEANRWGQGGVITESVTANIVNKEIRVVQTVLSEVNIENPVIGFRVRSSAGTDVMGTNTKIERMKVGTMRPGERIVVTWTVANILADGEYFIDPAVSAPNGLDVLDWWDEATTLLIKKDRKLPYTVDPDFKTILSGIESS